MTAGTDKATSWTAGRLLIATEEIRTRVTAAALADRDGVPVSPEELDGISLDLVEIALHLGAGAVVCVGPGDAPAIREASVAIATSRDLVAGLLDDARGAAPGC